jgi:hypothetical protein
MPTHFFRFFLFVTTLSLCLWGCTNGPKLIINSHIDYNKAVRQVMNEELLLNIVRMRYAEAPQFVSVSGITTQFQTEGGGGTNLSWPNAVTSPTTWGIDGSLTFTDNPTISIDPRQGEEVAKQLLGSINPANIAYLSSAGYRLDHLFVLLVENANGVRSFDVGGSLPIRGGEATFGQLVHAIGELQEQDDLICGFLKAYDNYDGSVTAADLKPTDYLAAIQSGKRWRELQGQPGVWALHTYDMEPIIWISPEGRASEAGKTIISLLNLKPDAPFYWLGDLRTQVPPTGPTDNIRLRMRSFYGVMNFLSMAVDLPTRDQEAGVVVPGFAKGDLAISAEEHLKLIFHIHEGRSRPDNAWVAVRSRNYWFYIDDRELASKRAFTLAVELMNLQISGGESSQSAPVLTLPLG